MPGHIRKRYDGSWNGLWLMPLGASFLRDRLVKGAAKVQPLAGKNAGARVMGSGQGVACCWNELPAEVLGVFRGPYAWARYEVWREVVTLFDSEERRLLRGFGMGGLLRFLDRVERLKEWEAQQARRVKRPPKRERPRCGAKTRKGTPCQAPAVWLPGDPVPRNGRCRMHGGLSTGPKTPEGKARIAESNRRRAQKRREVQGE